jgi:hypothetical protein
MLAMAGAAMAHSWYSSRVDPEYLNGCCGGTDCHELDGSLVIPEADGYRIRLTIDQARRINPGALFPVDALVPWRRVQPSEDGNWHICIFPSSRHAPRGGIICFFAPPNS